MKSILQTVIAISLIAVAIPVPLAAQPNNAGPGGRPGAVLACPPGQVAVRGDCVRRNAAAEPNRGARAEPNPAPRAEAHRPNPPPARFALGQRLRPADYRVVPNPRQHDLPPLPRGQRYVVAGGQLVVLEDSSSLILRILATQLALQLVR